MNGPSTNSEFCQDTLVIVGLGLLGGSIAKAARQRGLFRRIIAVGREPERLQAAKTGGIVDEIVGDVCGVAAEADVVVVCIPVDQIAQQIIRLHPLLKPDAVVTDVGSTKLTICQQVAAALGAEHRFVPAHPLAGSEKAGFEHACASLLQGAKVLLTPVPTESASAAIGRVHRFWQALGSHVVEMGPGDHDMVLAMTSHLPHLVSSALAASVAEKDLPFAATGFGDTTRIASGDPRLWTSIFMENSAATITAAEEFLRRFETLLSALKDRQPDRLESLLKAGKRQRDLWRGRPRFPSSDSSGTGNKTSPVASVADPSES